MVGEGWVLELRLQRLEPGKGLGLAIWKQPEEAGISVTTTEYTRMNPGLP